MQLYGSRLEAFIAQAEGRLRQAVVEELGRRGSEGPPGGHEMARVVMDTMAGVEQFGIQVAREEMARAGFQLTVEAAWPIWFRLAAQISNHIHGRLGLSLPKPKADNSPEAIAKRLDEFEARGSRA